MSQPIVRRCSINIYLMSESNFCPILLLRIYPMNPQNWLGHILHHCLSSLSMLHHSHQHKHFPHLKKKKKKPLSPQSLISTLCLGTKFMAELSVHHHCFQFFPFRSVTVSLQEDLHLHGSIKTTPPFKFVDDFHVANQWTTLALI